MDVPPINSNWVALKSLAALLFQQLRIERANWTWEDLCSYLKLPDTGLMRILH